MTVAETVETRKSEAETVKTTAAESLVTPTIRTRYNVEREDEPRGKRDPKRSGAGVRQPRESGARNDGSRSPTKMEASKRGENERPDRSAGRKVGDHDGKDVEERPRSELRQPIFTD